MTYYSDRERKVGSTHNDGNTLPLGAIKGIVAITNGFLARNYFAREYPVHCRDGFGVRGICATEGQTMRDDVEGRQIRWTDSADMMTYDALDLVEFCYARIAAASSNHFHPYFQHDHLTFDKAEGQRQLRESVNEVFSRNEVPLLLTLQGHVVRILPDEMQTLLEATFRTGDPTLDELLTSARTKFVDPRLEVRKEALEKLWDAWERLKTLDSPGDKRTSATILIQQSSQEQRFRDMVTKEAWELTSIGNDFMIRHSEVGKIPIGTANEVDYLFHRLFALMWHLMRQTNRT